MSGAKNKSVLIQPKQGGGFGGGLFGAGLGAGVIGRPTSSVAKCAELQVASSECADARISPRRAASAAPSQPKEKDTAVDDLVDDYPISDDEEDTGGTIKAAKAKKAAEKAAEEAGASFERRSRSFSSCTTQLRAAARRRDSHVVSDARQPQA